MGEMIRGAGRTPRQRNTLYGEVSEERREAGLRAGELTDIINTPARKYERKRKAGLVKPGLIQAVSVD